MKAYGKHRRDCAIRKLPGTQMACPCCIPKTSTRTHKKRARNEGKLEAKREATAQEKARRWERDFERQECE